MQPDADRLDELSDHRTPDGELDFLPLALSLDEAEIAQRGEQTGHARLGQAHRRNEVPLDGRRLGEPAGDLETGRMGEGLEDPRGLTDILGLAVLQLHGRSWFARGW